MYYDRIVRPATHARSDFIAKAAADLHERPQYLRRETQSVQFTTATILFQILWPLDSDMPGPLLAGPMQPEMSHSGLSITGKFRVKFCSVSSPAMDVTLTQLPSRAKAFRNTDAASRRVPLAVPHSVQHYSESTIKVPMAGLAAQLPPGVSLYARNTMQGP